MLVTKEKLNEGNLGKEIAKQIAFFIEGKGWSNSDVCELTFKIKKVPFEGGSYY